MTQYLDSSTETKLRATTERELLHNHAVSLVENESTGLVRMMEEDKLEGAAQRGAHAGLTAPLTRQPQTWSACSGCSTARRPSLLLCAIA